MWEVVNSMSDNTGMRDVQAKNINTAYASKVRIKKKYVSDMEGIYRMNNLFTSSRIYRTATSLSKAELWGNNSVLSSVIMQLYGYTYSHEKLLSFLIAVPEPLDNIVKSLAFWYDNYNIEVSSGIKSYIYLNYYSLWKSLN